MSGYSKESHHLFATKAKGWRKLSLLIVRKFDCSHHQSPCPKSMEMKEFIYKPYTRTRQRLRPVQSQTRLTKLAW